MHVGWAIEGSIGTDQKVDALFLSADAAIAQRIESLNEHYSSTILMTGELNVLLSDPGQLSLRQIDQVYIRESGNTPQEVYSFDMKPIEPLAVTNDEDEDELQAMANEKAPREVGGFIKYEEDSEEEDESPGLNQKDMPFIEKVYTMDHDFVCISKQRNDEFENLYAKGLESYINGDWIGAQMAFTMCGDKVDKLIGDGPLNHMRDLMEKSKAMPPDDWKSGYDWDKKPQPPDDIFPMGEEDSESELQGE
uniref:Uncharacterized protein n=1 Tax=Strombidium inclinatum TaxID=197538 RepID=A0A7S3IIS4_9SPIT|mmetsp:Transcript_19427/g.29855  ORF Transcript_19427/g.29855 Transcript_19427/m.29855 type:complete len:250 (+) Transcript_19427:2197-2946(+)